MALLEEYTTISANQTVQSKKNTKSCLIIRSSTSVLLSMLFLMHCCYPSVERAQQRLNKNFFSEILHTLTLPVWKPLKHLDLLFFSLWKVSTPHFQAVVWNHYLSIVFFCLQDLFFLIFSLFILENLAVCGWISTLLCTLDRIILQSCLMFLHRESQKST